VLSDKNDVELSLACWTQSKILSVSQICVIRVMSEILTKKGKHYGQVRIQFVTSKR